MSTPTAEQVREVMIYDPIDGFLRWRTHARAKLIGKVIGNLRTDGRREASVFGMRCLASHLVWLYHYGVWPKEYVRFKDGNYDNTRIHNLFESSREEAALTARRQARNRSGVPGVTFEPRRQQWQVRIKRNYKQVMVGYFALLEDAIEAHADALKDPAIMRRLENATSDHSEQPYRKLWLQLKRGYGQDHGWKTYKEFRADVRELPDGRVILVSIDEASPPGPGNFRFEQRLDLRTSEGRTENRRRNRAANPDRHKSSDLKKSFGITIDQYREMLLAQDGVCACCGHGETAMYRGKVRELAVDHDHRTEEVRALLCLRCNAIAGHADDDIERLELVIAYLRRHRAVPPANVVPLRKGSS